MGTGRACNYHAHSGGPPFYVHCPHVSGFSSAFADGLKCRRDAAIPFSHVKTVGQGGERSDKYQSGVRKYIIACHLVGLKLFFSLGVPHRKRW